MKILMVCLGNICRSPLAEGIMRHKIQQRRLQHWIVDSAGTAAWHSGERPDPRSVATARKYAIDITDQHARQFRKSDFDEFDLILTMDEQNYRDVLSSASNEGHRTKVKTILAAAYPGSNEQVPDPYLDNSAFDPVFHLLNDACEEIIEQLLRDQP